MKAVFYSKGAIKSLRRMPANTSRLMRQKIEAYARDPSQLDSNVIRLRGSEGLCRLRVGDWRVVFSETADTINVEAVGPRGSVYR